METEYAIKIPYLLGLIATRSIDEPVEGLKSIVARNEQRIADGLIAHTALRRLHEHPDDAEARRTLEAHAKNLGYALLLRAQTDDIEQADAAMIHRAALDSIPRVAPLFYAFRIMVAGGFALLLLYGLTAWGVYRNTFLTNRRLQVFALLALPLPWLCAELGWFVAEYGRQPWTISGILPTNLSTSSLSAGSVFASLLAFVAFYVGLTAAELFLMLKYARKGPATAD